MCGPVGDEGAGGDGELAELRGAPCELDEGLVGDAVRVAQGHLREGAAAAQRRDERRVVEVGLVVEG